MLSLESLEGGCSASSRNRFHVSLLVSIFRLDKVAATNLGSPAQLGEAWGHPWTGMATNMSASQQLTLCLYVLTPTCSKLRIHIHAVSTSDSIDHARA